MMDSKIILSESALIGAGGHKKVYVDPRNEKQCIKILFDKNDVDWKRELKYREIRKKRGMVSHMLPAYYGEVVTNLGTGYVFERVCDYDGNNSKDLGARLRDLPEDTNEELYIFKSGELLCNMLSEKVVTTNMEYGNFMVQEIEKDRFVTRIVDNIGTHATIPLILYIDDWARLHVKKYFLRLLNDVHKDFPHVISDKVFKHLEEYTKKV